MLQRVRELTVQANNDPLGAEGRRAIATEIRQHMESFLQLANSQDANGEYIFAGFQSKTRPFSHDGVGGFNYSGDNGQRMLKIGDSREVAIGDPGSIFTDFAASGGGSTNIGEVLYRLASNLDAGNGDPNALSDIDTAFTAVLETRAKIGARVNAIDDQKSANNAFELAVTKVRSSLEDLDYAEAISQFNQQLTALQASQQSFIKIQDMSLFNYLR
jgi:flagellar hook-associated protein 3 FlgL